MHLIELDEVFVFCRCFSFVNLFSTSKRISFSIFEFSRVPRFKEFSPLFSCVMLQSSTLACIHLPLAFVLAPF